MLIECLTLFIDNNSEAFTDDAYIDVGLYIAEAIARDSGKDEIFNHNPQPEVKTSCLKHQEFIHVNIQNTHIITVTTDLSIRLQQLWNSRTGDLLWQAEQKYDSSSRMWPRFSLDGQFSGFHDGRSSLSIRDAFAPMAPEIIRIELGYLSGDLQSMGIGTNGQRLALAVTQSEENRLEQQTNPQSINIVRTRFDRWPRLQYNTDGTKLSVISHDWDVHSNNYAVYLKIFDTKSGVLTHPRVDIGNFSGYRILDGYLHIQAQDCVVVIVKIHKAGRRKLGFVWPGQDIIEYRVITISPSGQLTWSPNLHSSGFSAIILSPGEVISVDSEGVVRGWDGGRTRLIAKSSGKRPLRSRVVAF